MRPSQYCCRAVGVRAQGRIPAGAAERLNALGEGPGGHGAASRRRLAAQAGRDLRDRGPVAMTRRPVYKRDPRVKDHINLFLYDGGIVPDPEHIITAGHNNKAARTISFHQGETVNAAALTTMLKQIVANNRAGGWRKLTNH